SSLSTCSASSLPTSLLQQLLFSSVRKHGSSFTSSTQDQETSVVEMKSDGHCLFRAMSHQMYRHQRGHLSYRKEIVHHIEEFFEPFVITRNALDQITETFEQCCKRMKKEPIYWGGEPELVAASRILHRIIRVYNNLMRSDTYIIYSNGAVQDTRCCYQLRLSSPRVLLKGFGDLVKSIAGNDKGLEELLMALKRQCPSDFISTTLNPSCEKLRGLVGLLRRLLILSRTRESRPMFPHAGEVGSELAEQVGSELAEQVH
ncbi:hypothetical protein HID58_053643, partial [Brassica napus]